MSGLGVTLDCNGANACQVPSSVLPCENQIVGLFQCFMDNIASLCAAGGQDNSGAEPAARPQPPAAPCQDVLTAFSSCADANNIDSSDMGMNMDPNPPGGDCNQADACTKCICKAGTDTTKLQACATDCANP